MAEGGPPDPVAREKLIVELLEAWPWDHGAVVIGGYAVSSYGKPRYSDDLDVVLPKKGMAPTVEWLSSYKPPFRQEEKIGPDWGQNYGGTVSRFVRGDATIDLLPNSVRDRDAKVDVPYEWIARSPRRVRLVLLEASTKTEIPVARPEAMWLLKLQSGRDQDISDLFAISDVSVALDEVRKTFESLWVETLETKLKHVRKKCGDKKIYEDALSRWMRGSPELQKNKRQWSSFTDMVNQAIPDM